MASSIIPRTLSRPVKYLFSGRCLLVTNTCCSCCLLGLGDFIQQTIAIRANKTRSNYDWKRTARMAAMGLLIGPMTHYWYVFLDGYLPGASIRTVVKKIACDQISCPIFSTVFVTGLGVLEGQSISSAFAEYRKKFIAIYTLDWLIWPPCQLVNFMFLPPQARVVYISCVQLFYNTCMSYIKHEVRTTPKPPPLIIVSSPNQHRTSQSSSTRCLDIDWARI